MDLKLFGTIFEFLGRHFLVRLQTSLVLRLASFGRHANPFEFLLHRALASRLFLFLLLKSFTLLLQPRRVVAFERIALATIELENPARDVVQEVTIVSHRDDRAFVLRQMAFQPRDTLGVEVVGRFVE